MSPNKKALFISYDGLTDPLGQSQILPYLKGLANQGHEMTVLSCEKEAAFNKRKQIIEEQCKQHNIKWVYCFYRKSPPILSTLLDLKELNQKALALHTANQFDVVHCRTILPTLIGQKLQERGAKLIFDIRGFWADERVDGKLWNLNNPLFKFVYRFVKRKEKKAYLAADHIITLTQAAKNELQRSFSLDQSKITVVPCTVDLAHFKRTDAVEKQGGTLRKSLNIKNENTVFCYSGSLGTRYLIKEMLACFAVIAKKKPEAVFLIITHHPTAELERLAQEYGVIDQLRITSTTYAEIPAYLTLADLGLYFIFAGNSGKAVSPTKQAEFLSLGIPIITNAGIGDSEMLIRDKGVGLVLDELNDSSYNQVLEQLDDLLDLPPSKMMELSQSSFNLEKGVASYHSVYSTI